jgi:hypothetical protein
MRSLSDPHQHRKEVSIKEEELHKKTDQTDEKIEVNLIFLLFLEQKDHFLAQSHTLIFV